MPANAVPGGTNPAAANMKKVRRVIMGASLAALGKMAKKDARYAACKLHATGSLEALHFADAVAIGQEFPVVLLCLFGVQMNEAREVLKLDLVSSLCGGFQ